MRRRHINPRRKREEGIIITLVAVFLLFVVGAMAALSIDVVTFYTARSEAQLAADGAALAGARVLANSGMTSLTVNSSNVSAAITAAEALAKSIATQVAQQNLIEGKPLTAGNITVSFSNYAVPPNNPHVTVQIQRTDLPTFFARIWGTTQVTVVASATAEAYNPSGITNGSTASLALPIAPSCVKPMLLPNTDPTSGGTTIFSTLDGSITDPGLLGLEIVSSTPLVTRPGLQSACTSGLACGANGTTAWNYYPGDPLTSFPPPSASSVECSGCTTPFQLGIAGCVQTPISCNQTVNIDATDAEAWNTDAITAVNALTHATANGAADSINLTVSPTPVPFQFIAGSENPIVQSSALTAGANTMVSDSLVTVPVFDNASMNFPTVTSVQVIGFLQLFLNPNGNPAPDPVYGQIDASIINMAGCGAASTGNNVLGNGGSAVPVRLITHP